MINNQERFFIFKNALIIAWIAHATKEIKPTPNIFIVDNIIQFLLDS